MFSRHHFHHWAHEGTFPHGRMFHRGDFKYLILDSLKDKPHYGYELIRELEERFHGFYSPSPGAIYPTLQFLEEAGYVTSAEQDGKKVYTITKEGLRFLEDRAQTVNDIRNHMRHGWGPWSSELRDQFRDVMHEIRELGRLLGRGSRDMNGEKIRRIGDILKKAYEEIEKIVREPQARS